MKERIERILRALDAPIDRTITVFGDYCLDKYLYIDPDRDELSVETGLVAYQVVKTRLFPGAGGTVANNLRALGAKVECIGLIGEDGEGYDLLRALTNIGAETRKMVRSKEVYTSTYTKPMRGTADAGFAEMNRLDIRNFGPTPRALEEKLLKNLEAALETSDGVIVMDQFLEKNGTPMTETVRAAVSELARKRPNKLFYADSRGFIGDFRNVYIKCNESELSKATEATGGDIPARMRTLKARNGRPVIVTLGEDGAMVLEKEEVVKIPAFRVDGPIDICGAGDATNAGAVLGLSLGLSLPDAVLLGGCVSSITIQQIGVTGTASVEQVKARLSSSL